MKALIVLLLLAGRAAAFPTGSQFDLDPSKSDGAGGIAFTGAPRWSGHTCAVCHTNAPGLISISLEADRPELFSTGWTPGTQYHLRVVLDHEHAGAQYLAAGDHCGFSVEPYVPCDENGFAIELDDANGTPQGTLSAFAAGACTAKPPTDADAYVLADGTAAMHNGAHFGMVKWDLCWTAPPAGKGALTAYLAAVDGNGGNGTIAFPNDATGDDVASGAVPIPEAGVGGGETQSGGCAAGDGGALVAIAVLAGLRKRRRIAAVLAVVALVGCAHVRPRQRETLAKRKMTFAPDPTEDELDLHMQEAREGSSGGYGSSGGGCGCN